MLSLTKLAKISGKRATNRLEQQKNNAQFPAIFLNEYAPYKDRLVKACFIDKIAINELIIVALPEKLLSKIAYLAVGPLRADNQKTIDSYNTGLSDEELIVLKQLSTADADYDFFGLTKQRKIDNLLLCHGLSPIGDSIALLAELGRLFRTSIVLDLPINVMLADISWMSSNRSIKQFKSLNEKEIDNGLRICLDKRQRLYKNLQLKTELKEISLYPRPNAISGKKLERISQNYMKLANALWGEKANGHLDHQTVSAISKPFASLENLDKIDDLSLPEHIKALSKFPKVLSSIDSHLSKHLQILRTVAKQFNSFEEEIFTYFFAQYYAQEPYKSGFLKIAPVSELKFDKPFSDLGGCFKAWDDDADHNDREVHEDKLPAIYLPQYKIGKYAVLPYSPLSLDILRNRIEDHTLLRDEIILLQENQNIETIRKILLSTDLQDRNRIVSDSLSFIMMTNYMAKHPIEDMLAKSKGYSSFIDLLSKISDKISKDYSTELNELQNNELISMWDSWFKNIENDGIFTPVHIHILLYTNSDWSSGDCSLHMSNIISIAIDLFKELT